MKITLNKEEYATLGIFAMCISYGNLYRLQKIFYDIIPYNVTNVTNYMKNLNEKLKANYIIYHDNINFK